ncbi:MAG TPA: DUF1800 domain-containing protein [Terracidiphilus sp.]|nr:DUF1800 domain-containing protein [Terracidiphilus sp.]
MERLKASLAFLLCGLLAVPSAPAFAQSAPNPAGQPQAKPRRQPYQSGQLQGDDRILHALNRFTFGTRPGDLEAVRSMGLERWFAQQLRPETIDNFNLEARLAQFPAMQWSPEDLLVRLPSNAMIRQAADGKVQIPPDGALHAVYMDEIARYENRQQQKQLEKQQSSLTANAAMPAATMNGQRGNSREMNGNSGAMAPEARQPNAAQTESGQMMTPLAEAGPEQPAFAEAQIASILALPPQQRVARLVHMQQPEFDAFRKALKGPQRNALNEGLTPAQKEVVLALENAQRVVNEELVAQRLTRDIYSNAQLHEVMTDFWLNHFNVYLHKNDETPYYLVSYERDVIRPRALGKFEDLLEATAHSPAMLLYLDNSSSMGPDSPAAEKAKIAAARRPNAKKAAPEGLNENYARELMELHTLGVNGGYTQADVTQVARVLTGWTVDKPQRGGGFKFDENRHEPGTKKVLGKKIKEHGEQEGRQLLHMLATRPATAKFISRKLAVRFVGDDPSQALIDRMAKTYLHSDGDISAVLNSLFHAPEFWSPDAYRAKVKTPLEYVVSAARASNANIDNMQPLTNALRDMGMPVYGAVPPTGYKWDASDWVSTGALVNRMNFALNLAANKLPGITIAWAPQEGPLIAKIDDGSAPHGIAQNPTAGFVQGPTPEAEEQRLEAWLVDGGVSPTTRVAVLNQFQAQTQTQNAQNPSGATTLPVQAKPVSPTQAAKALEKQDQLLAGLLLGSPEFQRR